MLKLSKKADYGLIAVQHLAQQPPATACSAKEIARAYGIPTELLAKILQKLAKNGLLVSQHGTNGGYVLARPSRGDFGVSRLSAPSRDRCSLQVA